MLIDEDLDKIQEHINHIRETKNEINAYDYVINNMIVKESKFQEVLIDRGKLSISLISEGKDITKELSGPLLAAAVRGVREYLKSTIEDDVKSITEIMNTINIHI